MGPGRAREFVIMITIFVAALLATERAAAAEPRALRVTRAEGASDCPDASSLAARAQASGAKQAYVASRDDAPEQIVVAFDREGEARRARIAASDGRTRTLVERAPDCEGLAEAVVVALVLSADAAEAPPAAPPPAPGPAVMEEEEEKERPPAEAAPRRGIAVRALAGATASIGVVRAIAPGATIGAHLGARDGRLRFGGALTFVPPSEVPLGDGAIRIGYAAAAIDACWAALRERPVVLEGCARAEVGALWGSARGFPTSEDHTRIRVAGGAVARAIAPIGRTLGVYVEASALAPVRRERFAVDGAGVAYDPPPVSFGAGGGLAVHFE